MAHVVTIHSFHREAGKSVTAANLAALLAVEGKRVGLVDADLQMPSQHTLFGLREDEIVHSLHDYMVGLCRLEQTVHDVTSRLKVSTPGRLYLVPSSARPVDLAFAQRAGYDMETLNAELGELIATLELQLVLIDTHTGLGEETLALIALSDALAVLLRPDEKDYQGTGVTIELARKLGVPRVLLVVNEVPSKYDLVQVLAEVVETFQCEVIGVLPYMPEMAALRGADLFALRYPTHPATAAYRQAAARLLE